MRPAILIHDKVYFQSYGGDWYGLLPMMVEPHARPGCLFAHKHAARLDEFVFVPFDRKTAYIVTCRLEVREVGGARIAVYRAVPRTDERIFNSDWKQMTKEMGREKQHFVRDFL